MDNGVSKKLFIVVLGLQAIIQMSVDAPEKFKYALLVAGVIVFYKTLQFLIDRKKVGGKIIKRGTDNETNT